MFDTEIEIDEIPVLVMVEATIYGEFLRATLEQPSESPIVEDLKVTVISDCAEDEELGGFPEGFDVAELLSEKEYEALQDEFFQWATDARNFGYDEEPEFDDYYEPGY